MFSFMANTLGHFYKNFQGFTYCSVFKVLCCFATARLIYHSFAVLSTAFLFLFLNIQRCLKGRFSVCSFVVEVRSTKLDVVSLRFANDLTLSSCFAFTKLLSVSRTRHILPPVSTKVNAFFVKFFELFQMYIQLSSVCFFMSNMHIYTFRHSSNDYISMIHLHASQ